MYDNVLLTILYCKWQELLARLTELENRNRDLEEQLSRVQQTQSSTSQSVDKKQENGNEPTLKKRKAFDFSRYICDSYEHAGA